MGNSVMVLGAGGMLGHKMFQHLRTRCPDTLGTIRGSLEGEPYSRIDLFQGGDVLAAVDATECRGFPALLRKLQPSAVVNCIGVIKQRPEASVAVSTITVNALLPHRLAEILAEWGGRVIHISTDCVFSGRRGHYTEDDRSDAEDLYGRTKALGEVVAPNALTLRTSMIGRELTQHGSLLDWLLRQNHGTVRGFTRAVYSGVTTNHLAEIVACVLKDHSTLSGLYQVTSDAINKYDLLCVLRAAYDLDIDIVADDTLACDRSLVGDKFHDAVGYTCPPWPALADQLATDSTPYRAWVGF